MPAAPLPPDAPLLHAFIAMDMDGRWANRTPEVMFQTFHWFAGEGFQLDRWKILLALPEDSPIGGRGISGCFHGRSRRWWVMLHQAVWLVPTSALRCARLLESARSTWQISRKMSNPEQALSNLLARDQLFTNEVAREATGAATASYRG